MDPFYRHPSLEQLICLCLNRVASSALTFDIVQPFKSLHLRQVYHLACSEACLASKDVHGALLLSWPAYLCMAKHETLRDPATQFHSIWQLLNQIEAQDDGVRAQHLVRHTLVALDAAALAIDLFRAIFAAEGLETTADDSPWDVPLAMLIEASIQVLQLRSVKPQMDLAFIHHASHL